MRITETFASIQGETTAAGRPAFFIRLAGCNLRCRWCDTQYSWEAGEEKPLEELVQAAVRTGLDLVVITGGEPLLQPESSELARRLAEAGLEVQVETNGSRPIEVLLPPVRRILDLKPPSSGEAHRLLRTNLAQLRPGDEVKCPVANWEDFEHSLERVVQADLIGKLEVVFSPVHPLLGPAELAEWVLGCGRAVRMQVPLHRVIWPGRDRGV